MANGTTTNKNGTPKFFNAPQPVSFNQPITPVNDFPTLGSPGTPAPGGPLLPPAPVPAPGPNITGGPNFDPVAASRAAGEAAAEGFQPATPLPGFAGSDPEKAFKLAKKRAKKGPFDAPPTFSPPGSDVLDLPVNPKGKIREKDIKRFEKENIFGFRLGQFPATAAPTAFQRGVFDPQSENAFNTQVAFSPEFNQQLLDFVSRPLEEKRDEAIRGLSDRFANLGRVGAGRFGQLAGNVQGDFGNALSDAVTKIALQQALGERAERLLGEERGFQSAETERGRRFAASQKGLDRRLQRELAAGAGGGGTAGLAQAIQAGGGPGLGQQLLSSITGGALGRIF